MLPARSLIFIVAAITLAKALRSSFNGNGNPYSTMKVMKLLPRVGHTSQQAIQSRLTTKKNLLAVSMVLFCALVERMHIF